MNFVFEAEFLAEQAQASRFDVVDSKKHDVARVQNGDLNEIMKCARLPRTRLADDDER